MVDRFYPPRPVSCGIILSYKCNSVCRHCMYACSPRWRADWISEDDLERILSQLSGKIIPAPGGRDRIGINYGLHFTGGEPFLNYGLLLRGVEIARSYRIPSIFVETNSFWCMDDGGCEERMLELREAGLNGMLVSVNPFIVEYIPFERIDRAIKIGRKVFGENLMAYQLEFYRQFKEIGLRGTMRFEEYLERFGLRGLSHVELLPMGRACYKLRDLFPKYPAEYFFDENCRRELTREWHTHIDNYGNYITGYCAGLSLGDARELDRLLEGGIDLDERPILKFLIKGTLKDLYRFAVREFGYVDKPDGYISKCDLCLDIRRHIALRTDRFVELAPREFYFNLE